MKFLFSIVALAVLLSCSQARDAPDKGLVRVTWKEIHEGVLLKHYSPSNRKAWRISYDAVTGSFACPSCDSSLPFVVYSHGFNGLADERWANLYNDRNVILIDWGILASPKHIPVYDAAAQNCIDVGRYIGKMLSALCNNLGITGVQIRLMGHSLGGHVIGNAGRTFQKERPGDIISRLTALDPAGPRWVNGPMARAIPELYQNRLRHTDGAFVDVIHTNAAYRPCLVCAGPRFGDLHQLGHADFYVGKGHYVAGIQPSCKGKPTPSICSHMMAIEYMMNTVKDNKKYAANECSTIELCKKMKVVSGGVPVNMGEAFVKPTKRTLYYVNPTL